MKLIRSIKGRYHGGSAHGAAPAAAWIFRAGEEITRPQWDDSLEDRRHSTCAVSLFSHASTGTAARTRAYLKPTGAASAKNHSM